MTMEAAVEVASNLRPDDFREIYEGHGHFPLLHLPLAAFYGDSVYFTVPNGKTAGLAGETLMEQYGCYAHQPYMTIL